MELFFFFIMLFAFRISSSLAVPSCNETCGNVSIPYPFGIDTHCGLPDHRISCKENSSLGIGPLPFLNTSTGEFQVISFSSGSLIINSTYFKAMSCDPSSPANSTLQLPDRGPYVLAPENYFAVVGCWSAGNFNTNHSDGRGSCTTACYHSYLFPFCNPYACCIEGIPGGTKRIEIQGARIEIQGARIPGYCGFTTVLNPDTYHTTQFRKFGAGHYGLKLSWGLVVNTSSQSCSTVNSTAAYACANHSQCGDVSGIPGYFCNCSEGYQGDGYRDGTGCTDIDECADDSSNNCVSASDGGHCTNTAGNYTCGCMNGYEGDGYRNGNRCRDIDECADDHLNNCVPPSQRGFCTNTPGNFTCGCITGYMGDGKLNGTGCTDIDECHNKSLNNCVPDNEGGICTNTEGNYTCSCTIIGEGNGIRDEDAGGTGCKRGTNTIPAITGAALTTAVAILVIGFIVWRVLQSRQSKKSFMKNGGMILTKYISSAEGRETPRL